MTSALPSLAFVFTDVVPRVWSPLVFPHEVCVCLGLGFGCAQPLLAGVLGCKCDCVCTPLVPPHSWLGCAVWVGVLGPLLRLRPATPGWAVPVCVCARALPVPRHSWLGCAPWVCVFGLGFRLRPATHDWGVGVCVCLCARSHCTPPLLAGVLGCVCVCVCARSACTPALPAGMCGVRVFVWAWVSSARRHSWLGCLAVCVFGCALRLYPATPGQAVRCGWVCLGLCFGCALPLLAWVLGCVCFVCVLRL